MAKRKAETGMDQMFPDVESKAEETKVAVGTSNLKDIKEYVNGDYEYITEAWQAEDAIRTLVHAPIIGFDCETVGLDPRTGTLRLIQLGTREKSFVFDCFKLSPKITQPVFAHATRIAGFHLAFDLAYLMHNGVEIPNGDRLYDCQLAAQVFWAGTPKGVWRHCSLANVTAELEGVHVDKEFQNSDWSRPVLSTEQLQYAAYDTFLPINLAENFAQKIYQAGLRDTMRLENRCLPALVWMEHNGALIDVEAWKDLIYDAQDEQLRLEVEMNIEAGVNQPVFGTKMVNWGSPAQVARVLRERGHTLDSSNESTLIQLAAQGDRLADMLVRYRHAKTRESRYGQAFLNSINPISGRIHAEFLQLGASESGRMSCIRPNLQNIPKDSRYRSCFISPDGFLLLGADYSQIELRLAAVIAGDPVLLDAYSRNADVHSLTAQKVMGIAGKPTSDQRFKAKAVNFGFIYGMGAEKFQRYAYTSYGVRLSLEEATAFRTAFFSLYKGLKRWHNSQSQVPIETRTLLGRRSLNVEKFSEKLNYPVQGSAGDIVKLALARLWEKRHQSSVLPFSVIHDEILCYVPANSAEDGRVWLEQQMEQAASEITNKINFVAEANYGANWKEAKG